MCSRIFVALILIATVYKSAAQQLLTDKISVSATNGAGDCNTLIYLPPGFSKNKAYPLVVYLHGAAQAGTNPEKLYQTGLPKLLKEGYRPPFDFIMVAPQSERYGVNPAWLEGLLQQVQQRWAIDTNRIYLTGIDAGGWAAFGSQLNVSAPFARKIAAIVTVSAATQNAATENIGWWKKAQTPLWAIAGSRDKKYLDGNKALAAAINKAAPGRAVVTALPGVAHGGWNGVFGGTVLHEGKTVWDWLYQFDRSKTFSNTHAATAALATASTLTGAPDSTTAEAALFTTGTHIEAENFLDRSGILIQSTRDFAGGVKNLFDVDPGDWISYTVNAPVAGKYTLCLRMACDALSGSRFQIKNGNGTVLTTVDVPNTNSWQIWHDVTAVVTLAAGVQTLKLQSTSATGWNLNYFEVVKTPADVFASYTLRPNSGTSIYLPNSLNLAHLKPGDTLNIPAGTYSVIDLGAFKGTASTPIIIRNKGGKVVCKIFRFSRAPEYFKLLGNGDAGVRYGFKIDGGSTTGSCLTAFGTGFEIAYVEALNSKSGFFIKKNPVAEEPLTQFPNYTMSNVYIHHNYIHRISGEGMYIGHTAADGGQGGNPLLPVRMRNVEIAYNIVDQTGWDGIQLANATTGNKIHHNTVTNFGTTNRYAQQAGILLGGNAQADIYDNTIKNGTGNGIQNFGFGLNKIYNNLIENVGRNGTERGYEAVYCNDIIIKSEVRPKQQIQAYNNTIKYPMPWGAIRVSGYNQNSLPATMQYNKVRLPNAPADWEKKYFPTYAPNSIISGNTLITQ